MIRKSQLTYAYLLAGIVFFASSTPAVADVKAGVDAWSAGDYDAAVAEWSGPAAQGDPDAQFNMAQAYRLGRGVAADPAQAEELYRKAAAQGHVKAGDNYGLLLFQNGRRKEALPYVSGAADRGDPRAQYLMGIAHFNGDLVEKDWVRGYAMMTLASNTGLPQARKAIAQMDQYVPLAQRENAQILAQQLRAEAEANRARDLAAVDLALGAPQQSVAPVTAPAPSAPVQSAPVQSAPVQSASVPTAANAGADFARPASNAPVSAPPPVQIASAAPQVQRVPQPVAAAAPVPAPVAATVPTQAAPAEPAPRRAMTGPWKVQLGAFGQPGNADRLWRKVSGHPALMGAQKVTVPAGRITRLQAGGFASRSAAQSACSALKRSGQDCLVTR